MVVAVSALVTTPLISLTNVNHPKSLLTGGSPMDRIEGHSLRKGRSDSQDPTSDRFDLIDARRTSKKFNTPGFVVIRRDQVSHHRYRSKPIQIQRIDLGNF